MKKSDCVKKSAEIDGVINVLSFECMPALAVSRTEFYKDINALKDCGNGCDAVDKVDMQCSNVVVSNSGTVICEDLKKPQTWAESEAHAKVKLGRLADQNEIDHAIALAGFKPLVQADQYVAITDPTGKDKKQDWKYIGDNLAILGRQAMSA